MAKLYYRYSSMGAGKSLDLLKISYNYEERGKNTILFTSADDDRYGKGKITTRVGLEKEALLFDKKTNIYDIVNVNKHPDCILLDESQFLTKEQVYQLTDIVDILNIPIICYGLRVTFNGNPFEGSSYLMALADIIEEVKTICWCGKKATMNLITVENPPDENDVVIGGNEMYVPLCRKHWKEKNTGK